MFNRAMTTAEQSNHDTSMILAIEKRDVGIGCEYVVSFQVGGIDNDVLGFVVVVLTMLCGKKKKKRLLATQVASRCGHTSGQFGKHDARTD